MAKEKAFNAVRMFNPAGSIQNLKCDDIAARVVVQDDAWFVLVALGNICLAKNNTECVDPGIVSDFHISAQYLAILDDQYIVTTTGDGAQSVEGQLKDSAFFAANAFYHALIPENLLIIMAIPR